MKLYAMAVLSSLQIQDKKMDKNIRHLLENAPTCRAGMSFHPVNQIGI